MLNVCFAPMTFTLIAMIALSGGALAGFIISALFTVGGRI
jgi:hypothetical protein